MSDDWKGGFDAGGLVATEADGAEPRREGGLLKDVDGTRLIPKPGPGRPRFERDV